VTKRVFRIRTKRSPSGRYVQDTTCSYTVVAPTAAEAMTKGIAASKKETGFLTPWRVIELEEIGEAV
jgi:hypothetical protein